MKYAFEIFVVEGKNTIFLIKNSLRPTKIHHS